MIDRRNTHSYFTHNLTTYSRHVPPEKNMKRKHEKILEEGFDYHATII